MKGTVPARRRARIARHAYDVESPRVRIPQPPPTMSKKPTKRIAPIDDPAEAVERISGGRIIREPGDVVIRREPAGRLDTMSMWRYALTFTGVDTTKYFARYETAAMEGEQAAHRSRARLIYVEDGSESVLMDYRPAQMVDAARSKRRKKNS